MKKIVLLIVVFTIISCKKDLPVDYAVISGKILNIGGGKLTFQSVDRTIKDTIHIAEDGSFTDTLRVEKGTYRLHDGRNTSEIYVDAGTNIQLNYDANDFKNTLVFSGIGFEISNYLFKKRNTQNDMMGEGVSVYRLEESDYKNKFTEIQTALDNMIDSSEGISEEFKTMEKRSINYSYLGKLDRYEQYHAHYANIPDFKTSEGFLKELEGFVYTNEEDFLFSEDYKALVTSNIYKQSSELAKTDSISEDLAFLKIAASVPNETIKNSLLFGNAKYGISYTEDIEMFYKTFMANSSNEAHKKEITTSYDKLKTVAKGQPSPKFISYENYAGGTTSLDDLKGKYVYIDVWATWCGPCKAEIPALKELEKKYHKKNIQFVSISVDKADDHDKWLKMIEEDELKGIQLFSDNDWNSDFVKDYLILGIPRFILIDPNGIIVNSNAPRPSDEKLVNLFKELNI